MKHRNSETVPASGLGLRQNQTGRTRLNSFIKFGKVGCVSGPQSALNAKPDELIRMGISPHEINSLQLSFGQQFGPQKLNNMEGYLIKRKSECSLKLFTAYTKRFFQLKADDGIFIYSKKKGGPPKECIPLNKIIAVDAKSNSLSKPSNAKHEFRIITRDRLFNLFAETKAEKTQWVRAFGQLLQLKNKFKYDFEQLSKECQIEGPREYARDTNHRNSHMLNSNPYVATSVMGAINPEIRSSHFSNFNQRGGVSQDNTEEQHDYLSDQDQVVCGLDTHLKQQRDHIDQIRCAVLQRAQYPQPGSNKTRRLVRTSNQEITDDDKNYQVAFAQSKPHGQSSSFNQVQSKHQGTGKKRTTVTSSSGELNTQFNSMVSQNIQLLNQKAIVGSPQRRIPFKASKAFLHHPVEVEKKGTGGEDVLVVSDHDQENFDLDAVVCNQQLIHLKSDQKEQMTRDCLDQEQYNRNFFYLRYSAQKESTQALHSQRQGHAAQSDHYDDSKAGNYSSGGQNPQDDTQYNQKVAQQVDNSSTGNNRLRNVIVEMTQNSTNHVQDHLADEPFSHTQNYVTSTNLNHVQTKLKSKLSESINNSQSLMQRMQAKENDDVTNGHYKLHGDVQRYASQTKLDLPELASSYREHPLLVKPSCNKSATGGQPRDEQDQFCWAYLQKMLPDDYQLSSKQQDMIKMIHKQNQIDGKGFHKDHSQCLNASRNRPDVQQFLDMKLKGPSSKPLDNSRRQSAENLPDKSGYGRMSSESLIIIKNSLTQRQHKIKTAQRYLSNEPDYDEAQEGFPNADFNQLSQHKMKKQLTPMVGYQTQLKASMLSQNSLTNSIDMVKCLTSRINRKKNDELQFSNIDQMASQREMYEQKDHMASQRGVMPQNQQIVSGANTIEESEEQPSPKNTKKSKNKTCKLKVELTTPEKHVETLPEQTSESPLKKKQKCLKSKRKIVVLSSKRRKDQIQRERPNPTESSLSLSLKEVYNEEQVQKRIRAYHVKLAAQDTDTASQVAQLRSKASFKAIKDVNPKKRLIYNDTAKFGLESYEHHETEP